MPISKIRKIDPERLARIIAHDQGVSIIDVPLDITEAIRTRFQLGLSRKAIAKSLGVNPNVVLEALIGVERHTTEAEQETIEWVTDLSLFP